MKCFIAILLLALFAIVMAVEMEHISEIKKISEEKGTQVAEARNKRGLALSAYAPFSYVAPYSSYNLPYAYSPYAYPHYRYSYYNAPYYVI